MSSSETGSQEATYALVVLSPFGNSINFFDDVEGYSDIIFIIPGTDEKPLHLHRRELGFGSRTINSLLKGDKSMHAVLREAGRVEWSHEVNGEEYRRVLVKWLRFLYGEHQSFSISECPSALMILQQLQLTCGEEKEGEIRKYILDTAQNDARIGAFMLHELVALQRECPEDDHTGIDAALADLVLTGSNIVSDPETFVEKCLLDLPVKYLELVRWNETTEEMNDFRLRLKYVSYHKMAMTDNEKIEVMKQCSSGLDTNELNELRRRGLLSTEMALNQFQKDLKLKDDELKKVKELAEEERTMKEKALEEKEEVERKRESERQCNEELKQKLERVIEKKEKLKEKLEEKKKDQDRLIETFGEVSSKEILQWRRQELFTYLCKILKANASPTKKLDLES